MSFLSHFFANDEKIAQELSENEPLLDASIERYFDSFNVKQTALSDIDRGEPFSKYLPTFRLALADEIALVRTGADSTKKLMNEIVSFHQGKDEEFLRLKTRMDHAASREIYVFTLMRKLYDLLITQARTVDALRVTPDNAQLRDALLAQLRLEIPLANELRSMDDLHEFYRNLALGEREKHELEENAQPFAEDMYEHMMETEVVEEGGHRPVNRSSIAWLTTDCFNKLETEVAKAINDGELSQHPHAIYEFVNSDLFEQFVHREVQTHDLKTLNDRLVIQRFIHIFRELYNNRLDPGAQD